MRSRIVLETRGQTIMLGVLTLLALAVMMMLTFTVNQVVHEKIRIQAHSDAVAYSTAVVEARAFNSTVYTNRAIAAALVAQMSLHAWMATATSTASILSSGSIAFGLVAAMEFIEAGFCPLPCCNPVKCVESAEAIVVAIQFMTKSFEYGNKVRGLEGRFNTAVASLKAMVDDLHTYQLGVLDLALATIGSVPSKLNGINAPRSTVNPLMMGENVARFACALEGSNFDDLCSPARTKATAAVRSKVIENAANAMRPAYDQLTNLTDLPQDFLPMSNFLRKLQHSEGEPIPAKFGSAYVGESQGVFSNNGEQAKKVGAFQLVTFTPGLWHEASGIGAMPAYIFSDSNGGAHFVPWAHSDRHDRFKGVQQKDVCSASENCFINFRASDDPNDDFGQPSAFASVQYTSLAERQSGNGRAANAWLINDKGTVQLQTGGGSSAKIRLIPNKPGIAISKAKAYFHQLGDWKAPPNFFDPFWRAKLHPFSRLEAAEQAGLAGDLDGAENAVALPIEGDGP